MAERLCINKLTACFEQKVILKDLSLEINKGEFVCLCGPNGAGKSTLLSVLAGIVPSGLKLSDGNEGAKLDLRAVASMSRKEIAKKIAFMTQNEYSTWDFSVEDIILTGRFAYTVNGHYSKDDKNKVQQVLSELKMEEFAGRSVHSLSGGEFQKVRIARALCQEPEFILMDEPLSSLDFVYEPQLMALLKEVAAKKNIGILISVHDVNMAARFADKVILLPAGKSPVVGTPSEVLNTENLEKTYGVGFTCRETKSFQSSL